MRMENRIVTAHAMMVHDLESACARACARGWRQENFVNELLSGTATRRVFHIPGGFGDSTYLYGMSDLPRRSWVNLRSRLVKAGLIVLEKDDTITIKRAGV